MEILKRYKDINGDVIAYDISYDGIIKKIPLDNAVFMKDGITNASFILSKGDYRAKPGYHIKTVIDINKKSSVDIDYYGKEFIDLCRNIRLCAISNNIKIDTSSYNGILLSLIKFFGISLNEFARRYLSNLQPYQIREDKNRGSLVCDTGFGTELSVKLEHMDNRDIVVVSLHKNNFIRQRDFSDKLCAVFVEKKPFISGARGSYPVYFCIPRGFLHLSLNDVTRYYDDAGLALVNYNNIRYGFDDMVCSLYMDLINLYSNNEGTSGTVKNTDRLPVLTNNNICCLLDLYGSSLIKEQERLCVAGVVFDLVYNMKDIEKRNLKTVLSSCGIANKLYDVLMKDLL